MICFKEVYDIFVGITSSLLSSILGAMPVQTVSLADVGVLTAITPIAIP